jgi:hypothetical protein
MTTPSTAPRRSSTATTMATARAPPVIPPGMPVRADATHASTKHQHQQYSQHHQQAQSSRGHRAMYQSSQSQSQSTSRHHLPKSHPQLRPPTQRHDPGEQAHAQRMSMPPPRTHRHMPPTSNPTLHSPYQAHGSLTPNVPSLRDSTRHNISRGSSRDTTIETPKSFGSSTFSRNDNNKEDVDAQFDQLLDTLQVADSVREKFQTVSLDVKSSILVSSTNSNPNILNSLGLPLPPSSPRIKKRMSTPLLRNVKSSASIQHQDVGVGGTYNVHGDEFIIVKSPLSPPLPSSHNVRGQSFDMPRASPGRPTNGPRPISGIFASSSSSAKGLGIAMGEQPDAFIGWLKSHKGTDLRMEVDRMKKLRMLLRHESTGWVQTFLDMGGYDLVLARLQDVLDVEWR